MAKMKFTIEADVPYGTNRRAALCVLQNMIEVNHTDWADFTVINDLASYTGETYYLGTDYEGVYFTVHRACNGDLWSSGIQWRRNCPFETFTAFLRGPFKSTGFAYYSAFQAATCWCDDRDIDYGPHYDELAHKLG